MFSYNFGSYEFIQISDNGRIPYIHKCDIHKGLKKILVRVYMHIKEIAYLISNAEQRFL